MADGVTEIVRRLRKLDACAVSDALDRLKLPGVVSGVPQQSGEGRIAGRVVTVKLGDNLRNLTSATETMLAHGVPEAPAWVAKLPLAGPRLFEA